MKTVSNFEQPVVIFESKFRIWISNPVLKTSFEFLNPNRISKFEFKFGLQISNPKNRYHTDGGSFWIRISNLDFKSYHTASGSFLNPNFEFGFRILFWNLVSNFASEPNFEFEFGLQIPNPKKRYHMDGDSFWIRILNSDFESCFENQFSNLESDSKFEFDKTVTTRPMVVSEFKFRIQISNPVLKTSFDLWTQIEFRIRIQIRNPQSEEILFCGTSSVVTTQ